MSKNGESMSISDLGAGFLRVLGREPASVEGVAMEEDVFTPSALGVIVCQENR
jgi:hypothetical protein